MLMEMNKNSSFGGLIGYGLDTNSKVFRLYATLDDCAGSKKSTAKRI